MDEERRRYSDRILDNLAEESRHHGELLSAINERTKGTEQDTKRINGSIKELWQAREKHESRISSLERWRAYIVGAVSAAFTGLGAWLKWGRP